MTWRCVWDIDVWPWHAFVEHDTEAQANLFALRKSREICGEVAVIRGDSEPQGVPSGDEQVRSGTDGRSAVQTPQIGSERIFVSGFVPSEGEA